MSATENTINNLTDRLTKTRENLQKLRNLRSEIGSKIIVEEAWSRYLESQIAKLSNAKRVSNDTEEFEF